MGCSSSEVMRMMSGLPWQPNIINSEDITMEQHWSPQYGHQIVARVRGDLINKLNDQIKHSHYKHNLPMGCSSVVKKQKVNPDYAETVRELEAAITNLEVRQKNELTSEQDPIEIAEKIFQHNKIINKIRECIDNINYNGCC